MCVYSMVGDHARDYLPVKHPTFPWTSPNWPPVPGDRVYPIYPSQPSVPSVPNTPITVPVVPAITREEFDRLREDVIQIKDLLKRAIKYDEEYTEPHCEVDEKVAFIKKLAEYVGVDLTDVLPKDD